MNWYLEALKKYAVFQGRSRRKEYWFFALFNIIISIVLSFIDVAAGIFSPATGIGLLSGLYALIILIPGISVTVRRLHDTGRTGWWLFIVFIPVIGLIVLLVFMVLDSDSTENAYGANPKSLSG